MHRLHSNHSNSFSDLAAFISAPPSNFSAKAEESSKFVSVGCCPEVKRKQEHIEQITEIYLVAQKKFGFKERAERD